MLRYIINSDNKLLLNVTDRGWTRCVTVKWQVSATETDLLYQSPHWCSEIRQSVSGQHSWYRFIGREERTKGPSHTHWSRWNSTFEGFKGHCHCSQKIIIKWDSMHVDQRERVDPERHCGGEQHVKVDETLNAASWTQWRLPPKNNHQ